MKNSSEEKPVAFGVIPVRGESSGLPEKNTRTLNDQPLLAYMIKSALAARLISRVFMSTDSGRVADLASQFGSEVIVHSPHLSTQTAPSFGVIENAAAYFRKVGARPVIIVTMRVTSPLCSSGDIDAAIEMLIANPDSDSVISVVRSPVHPYRTLKINECGELEHFDSNSPETNFPMRRQEFGDVYIRNGAIYATRTSVIEAGTLWGEHCLPYIMPRERSVNINDDVDFLLAETLVRRNQESQN
jgi:CMP-N-acetylneuraminic acid synthetase